MSSDNFFLKRQFLFLTLILTFLGLGGCSSDSVYEENIDLEDKTWVASDSIQFSFRIEEPDKRYNIFYNVRNTITYPYNNLYLSYYLKNSQGDTIDQNLMNIILFEPKTGKPQGKGLGDIFSHQYRIIPAYEFPDTGVYSLRLKQSMRMDSLPEILSIGISVKEEVSSEN